MQLRSPTSPEPCFGLAPMEGVSELALRLWMSQTSAPSFMNTPFLRATAHHPKELPPYFAPELQESRKDCPYELIPQVMTGEAREFVRTARMFLEAGASFVDLNAGCPSPNPISGGAGSALLRDPKSFIRMLQEICAELPLGSVSVKMRTGFEDSSALAEALPCLAELPLRQLTIHGRTRRDRYDGESRWDLIAGAARYLPYPVVASGDIVSYQSWLERAPIYPEAPRVIIGRGALRNPWIFTEMRQKQAVTLPWNTLSLSLAVLGLLFQAQRTAPERLLILLRSGFFQGSAGLSEEAWQALYQKIVTALLGQSFSLDQLCFDRTTMGRLKMIFHSLRSSLPEFFLDPKQMRVSQFSDWLESWRLCPSAGEPIQLCHRTSRDWLYTSSRKQQEATVSPESLPGLI